MSPSALVKTARRSCSRMWQRFRLPAKSGVGGGIGVLIAFVVSAIVNRYWASSVPLRAVLVGLGLSTAVGLFFGIYPASQAAKLDPIEALRTEN